MRSEIKSLAANWLDGYWWTVYIHISIASFWNSARERRRYSVSLGESDYISKFKIRSIKINPEHAHVSAWKQDTEPLDSNHPEFPISWIRWNSKRIITLNPYKMRCLKYIHKFIILKWTDKRLLNSMCQRHLSVSVHLVSSYSDTYKIAALKIR